MLFLVGALLCGVEVHVILKLNVTLRNEVIGSLLNDPYNCQRGNDPCEHLSRPCVGTLVQIIFRERFGVVYYNSINSSLRIEKL